MTRQKPVFIVGSVFARTKTLLTNAFDRASVAFYGIFCEKKQFFLFFKIGIVNDKGTNDMVNLPQTAQIEQSLIEWKLLSV